MKILFFEVHDATEDSLCERVFPGYDAFAGYLLEDDIMEAIECWPTIASIKIFHGERPPQGTKIHDATLISERRIERSLLINN